MKSGFHRQRSTLPYLLMVRVDDSLHTFLKMLCVQSVTTPVLHLSYTQKFRCKAFINKLDSTHIF